MSVVVTKKYGSYHPVRAQFITPLPTLHPVFQVVDQHITNIHGLKLKEGIYDGCPPTGTGNKYADPLFNEIKNRIDIPKHYIPYNIDKIKALPVPLYMRSHSLDISKWKKSEINTIFPLFHKAVTVTGYISQIDIGDKEDTNCTYKVSTGQLDYHIDITNSIGNGEMPVFFAEETPRVRAEAGNFDISKLVIGTKVRVSGWLFLDYKHLYSTNSWENHRQTLWEIHPVTKIYVYKDKKWISAGNYDS